MSHVAWQVHAIRCDKCGYVGPEGKVPQTAVVRAKADGWDVSHSGKVVCDQCQRKMSAEAVAAVAS